ncbi:MAG: hypothetical protein JXB36_09375 [Gammaproteobacteria bacterium]|nr:hypothetical protein [Gammaproteobacteria bacterium]
MSRTVAARFGAARCGAARFGAAPRELRAAPRRKRGRTAAAALTAPLAVWLVLAAGHAAAQQAGGAETGAQGARGAETEAPAAGGPETAAQGAGGAETRAQGAGGAETRAQGARVAGTGTAGARSAGTAAGEPVADTLDLGTTSITGNQELPKVLYIVPWKRADLGDVAGRPVDTLLDEVLAPVDPQEFERQLSYYTSLYGDGAPDAAADGRSEKE